MISIFGYWQTERIRKEQKKNLIWVQLRLPKSIISENRCFFKSRNSRNHRILHEKTKFWEPTRCSADLNKHEKHEKNDFPTSQKPEKLKKKTRIPLIFNGELILIPKVWTKESVITRPPDHPRAEHKKQPCRICWEGSYSSRWGCHVLRFGEVLFWLWIKSSFLGSIAKHGWIFRAWRRHLSNPSKCHNFRLLRHH